MIINPQTIIDKKIIEGPNFAKQQNGIDLTVGSIEKIVSNGTIGLDKTDHASKEHIYPFEGIFHLKKNTAYSITTQQKIKVPKDMIALVVQRSSLNRNGVFSQSGVYDSGFNNDVGFTLYCFNDMNIQLNARVAQIIFMKADSDSLYNGQYQK